MRPTLFESVLAFDRARSIVLDTGRPVERIVTVPLADADGRVAARDLAAPQDVPAFDRAAMDGYAVVADDTTGVTPEAPRALRLVGGVFTGDLPERAIGAGECMEIATGAPLPAGTTAVVMVEDTTRDGDIVRIGTGVRPGQNIGRRGADIGVGRLVVSAGDVLTPSRVGAIAAIGAATIDVFDRPSVGVLSTGNEVVQPGTTLQPGQVHDINQFTISAVVRRHGGVAHPLPPAGDTLQALHASLDAGLAHDIIVFSGGSSVGGRDLMVDLIRERGEILFHGIAVKPGKPTLFGRVGRSLVFGMPGYPTSCLSNAYMLLLPLVRVMAHLPPWTPRTVNLPLSKRVVSTPTRHQFYTVRIVNDAAEPAFKASGDITSMAHADGYFEIPVGVEMVEAGTPVKVTLF